MHRIGVLLGFLLLGCGGARRDPLAPAASVAVDEARERAAVGRVLDDFHAAAAAADEARYFGHFAPGGVFLGTDATERWDVEAFRRYAHPHFARGKAWSFRAARRAVTIGAGGAVAWFDEDLVTPNLGPARGSGVLVRDAASGAWKIVQYNLAITVPNERFGEVKKLLEGEAPPVP
jgi:hypothetical protein